MHAFSIKRFQIKKCIVKSIVNIGNGVEMSISHTCTFLIVLVVSSAGMGSFQASQTEGIFLKAKK